MLAAQSRALEVARGEANAALNRTRNQVEALFGQVEALKAANQKLARSANRAAPLSHTNRVIPGHAAAPSLAPKGGRIARNHQELVQLQKEGTRSYREFTLTTLKYTGRIEPISLTALKVDLGAQVLRPLDQGGPSKAEQEAGEPLRAGVDRSERASESCGAGGLPDQPRPSAGLSQRA